MLQKLRNSQTTPKLYILDNECSNDLKLAIIKNNAKYELVPPHQHRRNAAEKAIRTFKNHFLSGLATCDGDFPIHEWDRLLPQAEITLNLLRCARANPKLSAYAYLFGNYDYNAHPMVPPGTKVVVHQKPEKRMSWEYHGKIGWYIGPAEKHYRFVKCYVPITHTEIITDTVQFIPEHVPIPISTKADFLRQSVGDIIQLLKKDIKMNLPHSQFGNVTMHYRN